MKGRWRKDKRVSGVHTPQGAELKEEEKNKCLEGFTFSGRTAEDKHEREKRECLDNAHAVLVRSQFAMCDAETHGDFMVFLLYNLDIKYNIYIRTFVYIYTNIRILYGICFYVIWTLTFFCTFLCILTCMYICLFPYILTRLSAY